MKRIYHKYTDWEEIGAGMWDTLPANQQEDMLKKAIEFTGDYKLYGSWMRKVIDNWPISCENSLTSISINRKAWLGHAAVSMAIRCPENITRQAWGFLTDEQRTLANKEAENTIIEWEHRRKSKAISEFGKRDAIQMEYPMKLRDYLKQLTLFHLIEKYA